MMNITKHGRNWAVVDADGTLVCITLYKKGTQEVVKRLTKEAPEELIAPQQAHPWRQRGVFEYAPKF